MMASRTSAMSRAILAALSGAVISLPFTVVTGIASASQNVVTSTSCALGPSGAVSHVISIQFDNTHFLRDNPNVPSDIEQMPALAGLHGGLWHRALQ